MLKTISNYLSSSCSIWIFQCNKDHCSCSCRNLSCNNLPADIRSNLLYWTNCSHLHRNSPHSYWDDSGDGSISPPQYPTRMPVDRAQAWGHSSNTQQGKSPRHWIWKTHHQFLRLSSNRHTHDVSLKEMSQKIQGLLVLKAFNILILLHFGLKVEDFSVWPINVRTKCKMTLSRSQGLFGKEKLGMRLGSL